MNRSEQRHQLTTTLMFADICGSSRIYEKLGDDQAQRKISRALEMMRSNIEKHNGILIKEIGDSTMAIFQQTSQALLCATNIVAPPGSDQLQLRIGIHRGHVIAANRDIYGDAVNTAARIVMIASPQQILLSKDALENLPDTLNDSFRSLPLLPVRGKAIPVELCEYIGGRTAELTQIIPLQDGSTEGESKNYLLLRWSGGVMALRDSSSEVTIGRGQDHSICLSSSLVSRNHARIERFGSNWYISDQSSNGTLIVAESYKPQLLRRERYPLTNSGRIHLTPTQINNPDTVVFYRLD